MRYAPLDLGRWLLWGTTAVVFVVAPLLFTSSFALTLLTQMGSFIIFALSYNMLLGQGGMLSFGQAAFSGLGAYIAVHALNLIGKGAIVFPVTLLPLIGGLAGTAFGVLFGYVTTRRAGTTFALISLGVGEMVFACVLMFPGFFGGVPFFFGPILGAIVFIFFVAALSGFTKAWLLYLGLFFVLMVLYAPGGLASLVLMQLPVLRARRFGALALPYAAAAGAAALAIAGLIGVVEMVYHLSDVSGGTMMSLAGMEFDAKSGVPWVVSTSLLIFGLAALYFSSRYFSRRWHEVQAELKSA